MNRYGKCGQVTIIPLENKLIFTPTQKNPTHVPLMPNGPACALCKGLERAISCMWL